MKKKNVSKKENHAVEIISLMIKYGKVFSNEMKKEILTTVINYVLDNYDADNVNSEGCIVNDDDDMLDILEKFIQENFDHDSVAAVFGKSLEDYDDYELLEELKSRDSFELQDYVDEQAGTEENDAWDDDDAKVSDKSSMFVNPMPQRMEDLSADDLYRFLCEQFGTVPYDKKQFSLKFKDFIVKVAAGLPYHDGINIMQDIKFRDAPKPPLRKIIIK